MTYLWKHFFKLVEIMSADTYGARHAMTIHNFGRELLDSLIPS